MNSHLPPLMSQLQLLLTPCNGTLKDCVGGFDNLRFDLCTKVPGLAACRQERGAEWQSKEVEPHFLVTGRRALIELAN